jgi:hypothetical protein
MPTRRSHELQPGILFGVFRSTATRLASVSTGSIPVVPGIAGLTRLLLRPTFIGFIRLRLPFRLLL